MLPGNAVGMYCIALLQGLKACLSLQAVHHVEAMLGNLEACSQYDRLKSAVRGTRSQTSTLPANQMVLTG